MRQRLNARLPARAMAPYVCCLALAVLQACHSSGPDSPFKRYLSQLELALSVTRPTVRTTPVPLLPGVEQLQWAIPPGSIDTLDFLQLSGCAVQANIGRRQTRLGRFAKPSQRLLLELEYLRLAPACIHRLRDDHKHALADSLEAGRLEKTAQLPMLVFNTTLGSDEYHALWLDTPVPSDYPRSSSNARSFALAAINGQARRWLNGDYHAHNRDFELLLSEVAGGDGGLHLQDWSRQIDWLATADLMLEQGMATAVLCSEYTADPTAVNRTAIATAYFIDVIQPLIRQSQLHYREILAPVTALETQLGGALPPLYRRWITARAQHVAALTRAPDNHLSLLHRIQQDCKIE